MAFPPATGAGASQGDRMPAKTTNPERAKREARGMRDRSKAGGYEHPGTNSPEARLMRLAELARKAAEKAAEATTERDKLIVLMREQEASLATIGAAVGMSRPGVLHVLRREASTNGQR